MFTAMRLFQGAVLRGPAGTGKTETIIDLAKTVGVYCAVFNCQSSLDHVAMAKLLNGLLSTGGWWVGGYE